MPAERFTFFCCVKWGEKSEDILLLMWLLKKNPLPIYRHQPQCGDKVLYRYTTN